MEKEYDFIFLINLPAFYKINLYNRIASSVKVLVVFTEKPHSDRNADFYDGTKLFDFIFLHDFSYIKRIGILFSILTKTKYSHLVIGGWDNIYNWLAAFVGNKKSNSVVVESSCIESSISGIKGMLKKIFVNRVSCAYVSGICQFKLVESLGFKGRYVKTKGVGIFNIIQQPPYEYKESITKFLFVGRLVKVKNLEFLVRVFNRMKELELHIVGFGELEANLKQIADKNIIFHGAVDNKKLSSLYQMCDVFILPSISETWGLVVEEALNNGLPVIISDRIGCNGEVVQSGYNGEVFISNDEDSLKKTVLKILDVAYYNNLRYNVSRINFEKIAEEQINSYLKN